jgi:hypothetical protein
MVLYKKIFCQRCDFVVDKVTNLISGQASRKSKPSDDVLKDKCSSGIYQIFLEYLYFNPYCEVNCCGNDVSSLLILIWHAYWFTKINHPLLESLKCSNWLKG